MKFAYLPPILALWLAHSQLVTPIHSADPAPPELALKYPNAAVVYWQAFAAWPPLSDEDKTKYEAAIKSTTEPVREELKPIVALFENSLRELHRARTISPCDWNLDYSAGAALLMPHVQKGRDLSRAALLRARMRFAAGENDEALADVLAVFKLARDIGGSPLLISLLVDVAIETMATDVLAGNLPGLTRSELEQLTQQLQKLPPTLTASECVRFEQQMFGDWVERKIDAAAAKFNDPEAGGEVIREVLAATGIGKSEFNATTPEGQRQRELLESLTVDDVRDAVRQLRTDYAEMATITALKSPERQARMKELEARLATTNKLEKREELEHMLSQSLLPAVEKVAEREEWMLLRRAMLLLAIHIQQLGPEEAKMPFRVGERPVDYRAINSGFELSCKLPGETKPVIVCVGRMQP